ncbi:hypothetical protein [Mycetocola sp. JXN-3]|uniref:hypothetical protein n=1 Tax=Mycetocola sp. JXN-3 TaxID=2116510 RepID=UPI00165D0262|nr:hypothetical protein [Mycetocola sp. JXN-3]
MDPIISPHTPDRPADDPSVGSSRDADAVDPAQALPSFPAPPDRASTSTPEPETSLLPESEIVPLRPNLALAIIGTILFLPVGIFGLWQTILARRGLASGAGAVAIQRAGRGRTLSIVAVCVGALGWLMLVPLCILLGFGVAVNSGGLAGTRIVDVSPAEGARTVSIELQATSPEPARYTVLRPDGSEYSDTLTALEPIRLDIAVGDYAEIRVISDRSEGEVSCTVRDEDDELTTQHGSGFALCGVAGVE